MTRAEALDWCARYSVDISFRSVPGSPRVRLRYGAETIEADELPNAVQRLKRTVEDRAVPSTGDDTPLYTLEYEGRNCRGRVMRMARAIDVKTVGELLAWSERQPQGLSQITRYPNVGRRSLEILEDALRRHGVEQIPGLDRSGDAGSTSLGGNPRGDGSTHEEPPAP